MDPNQKFTILSFVGGGIRGLMSATILQRLANSKNGGLLEQTTMLAGCSTGAIITSELLANVKPLELIQMFTGEEIGFYNNMNDKPDAPAYPIADVLYSQNQLHHETPISAAAKSVLLVSFNVGKLNTEPDGRVVPKPWDPIMFTNMLGTDEDKANGLDGNGDTPIAVAASSSGAMPGQLGSVEGNVDGAFFNHDPTMAAICLAVHNGVPLENIVAITIGTGYMPDWLASDTANWGAKQWMDGDANPFDNTPPFLMNQRQPSPMLDMCLNGTSAEMMPRLCKMLLGDRYVNINPRLPCFIPENSTNSQAIELLQWHGQNGEPENVEKAIALIDKYWSSSCPPIKQPATTATSASKAPPARASAKTSKAATDAPEGTPGHGEFFVIQNKDSKKVLDVRSGQKTPGAPVILYRKKGQNEYPGNQQWQFVPSEEDPGWWYLQAAQSDQTVLTLQTVTAPVPLQTITMEAKDPQRKAYQLWNLVSTEDIGWWFIQCQAQLGRTLNTNSSAVVPTVVGFGSNGVEDPVAAGVSLDYFADTPMAWGFLKLSDAQ